METPTKSSSRKPDPLPLPDQVLYIFFPLLAAIMYCVFTVKNEQEKATFAVKLCIFGLLVNTCILFAMLS